MSDQTLGVPPRFWRAVPPLRTALALGCAALTLIGCGGGSGDTPPPPPLAAPVNFKVLGNVDSLEWAATPGATRYELHVDPDGTGPLPETKVDDYNEASVTGFAYRVEYPENAPQGRFTGFIFGTDPSMAARLNETYRLRACDASACGAFTAPTKSLDIVNRVSHEFASGRVPLKSSVGVDGNPRLSKDGLTLAIQARNTDSAVYVFTRSSSAQPWQQQALLRSGKNNFGQAIALSADGNTLAVQANEQSSSDSSVYKGVVYLYQRSGSTWNQQAFLENPSTPSACPRPCRADITPYYFALSADGSLLAASVGYGTYPVDYTDIRAVATYARTGATWAPQATLDTGNFTSGVLSSDGNTLAVNEGAFNPYDSTQTVDTTPVVRVFVQQSNGTWNQQARIPAGIFDWVTFGRVVSSTIALSSDGNTLAVHALNQPGHPTTPELDLQPADLSCGSLAADAWYIALYARNGTTWQRQTAISRGLEGSWALASDGNALFYGGATFTRSNGTWACP